MSRCMIVQACEAVAIQHERCSKYAFEMALYVLRLFWPDPNVSLSRKCSREQTGSAYWVISAYLWPSVNVYHNISRLHYLLKPIDRHA